MRCDFETIINRSACGSVKWEGMKKHNPNVSPDVLPLLSGGVSVKAS